MSQSDPQGDDVVVDLILPIAAEYGARMVAAIQEILDEVDRGRYASTPTALVVRASESEGWTHATDTDHIVGMLVHKGLVRIETLDAIPVPDHDGARWGGEIYPLTLSRRGRDALQRLSQH